MTVAYSAVASVSKSPKFVCANETVAASILDHPAIPRLVAEARAAFSTIWEESREGFAACNLIMDVSRLAREVAPLNEYGFPSADWYALMGAANLGEVAAIILRVWTPRAVSDVLAREEAEAIIECMDGAEKELDAPEGWEDGERFDGLG